MTSTDTVIASNQAYPRRLGRRYGAVCCLTLLLLASLAIFALGTGTIRLDPSRTLNALVGAGDPTADRVVWLIRLPRLLTAIFVGGCLGMAGAVFQSISRNPLGSPDLIGFTTGAAAGAVAQIVLFNAGTLATALSAIGGGLATASVVYALTLSGGRSGSQRLVLVGIGIGACLSAVTTILLVRGNLDQAMSAQLWLAGSLDARGWDHAVPVALAFVVFVPLALALGRPLSLIEMGDDPACQLGVAVERTRLMAMVCAVAAVAVATASAGPISFVALIAPQVAKRLTRESGVPIVTAVLVGAILVIGADIVSQNLPIRAMLPIGLTTSLLGGVYLIALLLRTRTV